MTVVVMLLWLLNLLVDTTEPHMEDYTSVSSPVNIYHNYIKLTGYLLELLLLSWQFMSNKLSINCYYIITPSQ